MARHGHIEVPLRPSVPTIIVMIVAEDSFGKLVTFEPVPLSATTGELSAAASRAIERWQSLRGTHIAGIQRQSAQPRREAQDA